MCKKFNNEEVPLMDIFKMSCKQVLENCLTGFDIEKHLIIIDETVDHQGAGRKVRDTDLRILEI